MGMKVTNLQTLPVMNKKCCWENSRGPSGLEKIKAQKSLQTDMPKGSFYRETLLGSLFGAGSIRRARSFR